VQKDEKQPIEIRKDIVFKLFACIDTKRTVLQQERGVESKQIGITQVEQLAACVAKKELYP